MQLVVNEKPRDWSECPFAEKRPHEMFYAYCKLSGFGCTLDSNNYCDRLLSIREVLNR